jgi:hypothetical protein
MLEGSMRKDASHLKPVYNFRPLADGLSTEPYPHVVLEDYADSSLMAQAVEELVDFEAAVRKPQKDSGGYCYTTLENEMLAKCESYKIIEEHFRSQAFYDEMVDTLGPFAPGRLSIDIDGIRAFAHDPEHRYAAVKLSGPGPDYVIRTPHLDSPTTILTCLFYIRLPNDYSSGGSLNVHSVDDTPWTLKKRIQHKLSGIHYPVAKTVDFKSNTLLLFLNSNVSVHSVSVRRQAEVSRMVIHCGVTGDREYF